MIRRLMISSLAAMTLVTAAWAQTPTTPTPASGANRRLEFLAGYLSLTDAQKTQAQAIFDAAESAATTAAGAMTSAQTALRTAIKANAADAELDRLAAAIGVVQGQVAAIHAKAEAKFYALLTADQKTKYDALGQGSGGPGGGKGPRSLSRGLF